MLVRMFLHTLNGADQMERYSMRSLTEFEVLTVATNHIILLLKPREKMMDSGNPQSKHCANPKVFTFECLKLQPQNKRQTCGSSPCSSPGADSKRISPCQYWKQLTVILNVTSKYIIINNVTPILFMCAACRHTAT